MTLGLRIGKLFLKNKNRINIESSCVTKSLEEVNNMFILAV